MNTGKIAVQMMMLKGKVQESGVFETMKRLSELGFHAVEVSQIPMTKENVSEFKQAAEDLDIEIAALSTKLEAKPDTSEENLTDDFEKVIEDCKILNCNYLRLGMLPLSILGDKKKIMKFGHQLEKMASKLYEHGINLYYHTHHVEFQKYDGEYLLDLIKNNTTKLGFELDVHWTHRAGVNPIEILEEYAGRISLLHLKDYRMGEVNLEGVKDRATYQQRFHNIIEFAEIGEGNLKMPAIIDAGLEYGAIYFIIEQDNTYGRDPFESLQISANNLRSMGYADWF